MLSKIATSTIFWVFGIIQPGIEPRSPIGKHSNRYANVRKYILLIALLDKTELIFSSC